MSPRFRVSPGSHDGDEQSQSQTYSEFEYDTIITDCPLCGEHAELDFHHWVYPPADVVGTHLCRSCHLYIHGPDGARPSEAVGNEWVRICIERLFEIWVSEWPWLSASFMEYKFSIPEKFQGCVDKCIQTHRDEVEFFDPRRRGSE